MARSALIAPEALQCLRRRLLAPRQPQWVRQVVPVSLARDEVARCPEALHRTLLWYWGEDGHPPATIRHLNWLAGFDPPEKLTGSLPELPHSNGGHVLLVAHERPAAPGQRA